ncbi:hypothetical protein NIES2119_05915 [[Phormidium ambiguum] IAM M-71]|uniref:Uncharacterized protein n=1 Tax=[Phormidium ambiguum] IAM M-71 TaxID=454136 RepID=A0A1U7IPD1_9CYAN|nr:hypothetical protein [Phormidium ambiguum]OKH39280.1 hypothetical protein NIES2119_05915 [Phormidium ambiguum IAM M-71]
MGEGIIKTPWSGDTLYSGWRWKKSGFDLGGLVAPPVPVKSQYLYLLLYSFAEHFVIYRLLTIHTTGAVDCDRQVV